MIHHRRRAARGFFWGLWAVWLFLWFGGAKTNPNNTAIVSRWSMCVEGAMMRMVERLA